VKTIYLDTCVWNALAKLTLPDGAIEQTPASEIVISRHVVYELAKTHEKDPEFASQLFKTATRLFDSGAKIINEPFNILIEEMKLIRDGQAIDFLFPNRRDFRAEMVRLQDGTTDQVTEFIASKLRDAETDKNRIAEHLSAISEERQFLSELPESSLNDWITKELLNIGSLRRLLEKLIALFPEEPTPDLLEWAQVLLRSPECKVTQGLLRTDLYYNWRCAKTDRNVAAKDLLPDTYHVINALYCSAYVTSESKQRKYLELLGLKSNQFYIWDGVERIDMWLKSVSDRLEIDGSRNA